MVESITTTHTYFTMGSYLNIKIMSTRLKYHIFNLRGWIIIALVFTHKRYSFHTPAALLLSSQCQCSLAGNLSALPPAGHRRSVIPPACRCIPAGAAPAAPARSPSACTQAAGSLCPCRPPSAGTHESWHY